MLNLCESEIEEGRKVLLFSVHVSERPQTARFVRLLREMGFRATELQAKSVKASSRERWLENITAETDVLVANPEAVKTGLDLLEFRSLIFSDVSTDPYTVRQAMSRSLRLTQKEEVRIFHACYEACWEEKMTHMLARKLQAMGAFAGDVQRTVYDSLVGNPYEHMVEQLRCLGEDGIGEGA